MSDKGSKARAGGLRTAGSVSRRRFVRLFATGTAVSAALGETWIANVVAGCAPGTLQVRISDFPALEQENGSVRLAFNPFTLNRPLGPYYPVLVNRAAGDRFCALSTRCTHASCVVDPFSPSQRNSACRFHGSKFSISGARLSGPANLPLDRHDLHYDGDDLLCIMIPEQGLHYSVRVARVDGSPATLQLEFPSTAGLTYEVLARESVEAVGRVTPFALEVDGPLVDEVAGTGETLRLYVARSAAAGFFSVAVKVEQA